MAELKNQIEKIDQECINARQLLEKALQKTNNELREEIKVNDDALRQELTQNLKKKNSKEFGSELRKSIEILKQDLKDDIFQEIGINLQQGLGNFKKEITEELQQNLGLITQHQQTKHDELLKLIKDQGYQQVPQSQSNDSSTSNTSPPPLPPPPYNSNPQTSSQYQHLMIYPPKAKIELSKYNGSDNQCVAWFNKTEEYFQIYNITTDEEKVKYASMFLEGTAYNWYIWWKGRIQSYTWNSFKNDFFKRFQGISEKELFFKLTRLQQKRNVDEFTHQWESLATRVFGLSDDQLLQSYIGGLKPHIQDELKLHEVTNVEIARHKAKAVEEKLEGQSRFGKFYSRRNINQNTNTETDKYIPPNLREDRRSRDYQRIREGICKYYGEKWDPRHRCRTKDKSKKLYTCQAENIEESNTEESVTEEIGNNQNDMPDLLSNDTPRISLAANTSISQPQTLKLKGHIKKDSVAVLIDIGSTHNFLDINVARNLKLFVYPVPNMKVMVADGKKIENVGKCHKVKLQIRDFNLESEFYTVPLGGVDVVLGVQWLQTLGTYSVNHQEHFIKFKWQGQTYKLYGFQPPQTQVVSSQQMEKMIRKGATTYFIHCLQMGIQEPEQDFKNLEIQDLIQTHKKVFQDLPVDLPPQRRIEHIIEIKPKSSQSRLDHTDTPIIIKQK
jgi:hypothetical protein